MSENNLNSSVLDYKGLETYHKGILQKFASKSAEETLGMHNMVQTVEIYEDMVTIRAISISNEQKNTRYNFRLQRWSNDCSIYLVSYNPKY